MKKIILIGITCFFAGAASAQSCQLPDCLELSVKESCKEYCKKHHTKIKWEASEEELKSMGLSEKSIKIILDKRALKAKDYSLDTAVPNWKAEIEEKEKLQKKQEINPLDK
ncbi:MAG: hypothetical protein JWO44_1239 [Bacteroidetes bacterium]|nr:hypothetical protein [Bacteroidota bacterium]